MSITDVQYVTQTQPMMFTSKRRRLTTADLCFLSLMLLCATEVRGDLEPTADLNTPVSPEIVPTRQSSLREDVWEGSGMSAFTPNFYHSEHHPSLPVQRTSISTPFLPTIVVSSDPYILSSADHLVTSARFDHSQDVQSTDTRNAEPSWLSGFGGSSAVQEVTLPTPNISLLLPTRTSNWNLPLSSSDFFNMSSENEQASSIDHVSTTSPVDQGNVRLLSTLLADSSLQPSTCTPASANEFSLMSDSSKLDKKVKCILSSVIYDDLPKTVSPYDSEETSLTEPSIQPFVSESSHKTTEISELPSPFVSSNVLTTTVQLTSNEAGISTTPTSVVEKTQTPEVDMKESHYTLSLRTKKCPSMFSNELQRELSEKTFRSANYSTLRWNVLIESCTSHLNVSIRTRGPSSFDDLITQFNTLDRSNISIRVLNRTFYIVHIQKHDDFFENKTTNFDSNSTRTVSSRDEFPIYVSLGASFVAALVASIILCCVNFCVKRLRKPVGSSRGAQMHRRFEDYTLTPIPRPSSLYVDYYRGSVMGDHYSTTSAGSITSTPTVDQGVVQPFDTCIVPLEDSETVPEDTVKNAMNDSAAVAHVPNFSFHPNANPILAHCITAKSDSNERLHPKYQKVAEVKHSGLENPSFQRF